MNLRIDTDASSLTASQATRHARPAPTSASDGGEDTQRAARSDTSSITAGRPAPAAARAGTGPVTTPDPSVALELSRGQIATHPAAALQAQANSTPESVLRLLY